jgi:hypothetical protein
MDWSFGDKDPYFSRSLLYIGPTTSSSWKKWGWVKSHNMEEVIIPRVVQQNYFHTMALCMKRSIWIILYHKVIDRIYYFWLSWSPQAGGKNCTASHSAFLQAFPPFNCIISKPTSVPRYYTACAWQDAHGRGECGSYRKNICSHFWQARI